MGGNQCRRPIDRRGGSISAGWSLEFARSSFVISMTPSCRPTSLRRDVPFHVSRRTLRETSGRARPGRKEME